ncbi:hypothetical protein [Flaviflexus equikiangi]|uniref:Uncharacterized protein n=1 Tax=Flaviflexus equikiangi TaxID=2758573 RepID=A0ABS2TCB0_9ACTO|nr:hypothetical protein [Flaviflexus equikiangi]MBM9432278.1 hypothetical protein [Flaviflexus equikiangi]
MNDKIFLAYSEDGLLVLGEHTDVERYLGRSGLAAGARSISMPTLKTALGAAASSTDFLSKMLDASARYLKLTRESWLDLLQEGKLMPTNERGVSYAMLGKPGDTSLKWLKTETGLAPKLVNPATLSGLSNLLWQYSQLAQAEEFRAAISRVEHKIDDLRDRLIDQPITKLEGAGAGIQRTIRIWEAGGSLATSWVATASLINVIHEVERSALKEIERLAEGISKIMNVRQLESATLDVEKRLWRQLTVLMYCYELENKYKILELEHVRLNESEKIEPHRQEVNQFQVDRREKISLRLQPFLDALNDAGLLANTRVLLHRKRAGSIIDNINSTMRSIDGSTFSEALRAESQMKEIVPLSRSEASRDLDQWRAAGREIGPYMLSGAGSLVGGVVLKKLIGGDFSVSRALSGLSPWGDGYDTDETDGDGSDIHSDAEES